MGVSVERLRRNRTLEAMRAAHEAGPEKDWGKRARCKPGSGYDPEIFFPTSGGGNTIQARAVCQLCEVRASCLAEALAGGRNYIGMWGGFTETERTKYFTWLRKQLRKKG